MNNFGRAIRLSLRHRWTFAGSVVCAVIVALLWGGNITAIYPVAEVVFNQGSMHEWADERIARTEEEVARHQAQLDKLDQRLAKAPADDRAEIEAERSDAAWRLDLSQRALGGYQWANRRLIEPYMPQDAFSTILVVAGALLVGTLIKNVFLICNTILVSRLAQLATHRLTNTFFRRTLRMDLASFTNEGASDLMSRFTYDMESLSNGLRELFGRFVREPLKMVACLAGAAWVCWRLLLLSMVLAPLAAILIRWLSKSLKRANRRAMEEMSQIYNTLDETFQGIKVVKAFTMERTERRRFHMNRKEYYRKAMKIARYDALIHPSTEVLGIAMMCVALLAGAYLGLNGQTHLLGVRMSNRPLDFGLLMMFFGFLAGVSDPARKMSDVFNRIQRAAAAADRIYQSIDREPTVVEPRRTRPLGRHRRELAFDGVSFHYQPTQPVLRNIDLRIPFGETVAIVGPNGCGKSTLVNLIPRFYDPVSGAVRLDGVDLRDVRFKDLRGQIGLVTQETLLFDDTVLENIRYGSPHATRAQVVAAAKQAHAHRFIEEKLEHGYESCVGPRGNLLSGGQRQRIALARAILRDPAILVLDEATSQIDLESEQLIHKVLEQFIRDRTTVIITHRMSTLALADRIVVMEAGGILDVGTHDELLRRCGLYGRLHEIQFRETA